jgi:serine/threonine protein kinase
MTILPPPNDDVLRTFPEIRALELFKIGGFKVVYRIETAQGLEAFKLVRLPFSGQDNERVAFKKEALGRVRREIEALNKCSVPELVRLGSINLTECTLGNSEYVAYSEEFLNGTDLCTLIRAANNIPSEAEIKTLFACLLKAIRELWKYGYIHRDIKPLNVIKLQNPGRPFVLLDLGIAYCVNETALTYNPDARMPIATYRYIAPEMASPNFRASLDYRSDLYSAALTVYEYGAKRHPLARDMEDYIQSFHRAVHDLPKPFKQYRQDLSDDLCWLIDQTLKKKPALRPSNLDQLISLMEDTS